MQGDAIEAIEAAGDARDVEDFDKKITLFSCYKVTAYICTRHRPYMTTVDHEASLIIGKRANFEPIPDANIPTVYFNFASYESLNRRLKATGKLTGAMLYEYLIHVQ